MKLISLLLSAVFMYGVNSISFYAQEGKEKCFSDEIPSKSVVIVYHELKSSQQIQKKEKVMKYEPQKDKIVTEGLEFRIYDPQDKKVEAKDVKPGPNKLAFSSDTMGRYRFCIYKAKSFWKTGEYKYSIKIQQGVDFQLQDAANKTHVTQLQDRIDSLANRTQDFIKLQQLNRDQEDRLTMQSVLINQRVVQTTIIQILVLITSGVYQIWSLRRFFKQRFLL